MSIPSFIVAAMKTTVEMNGVFVRFNHCIENLQRFCRPVMFHNDDPMYEASYAGSSFLLRHRNRNVLLCTDHQLGQGDHKRQANEIMIILNDEGDKKVGLTPNGVTKIVFHDAEAQNLKDIALVEYASDREGRDVSRHFYRLDLDANCDLNSIPPERIVLIFSIGYPSAFSSFETTFTAEYEATGLDITSRWCKLYMERAQPGPWDLPFRIPVKLHSGYAAEIGDPDGFSGSPVFFIYQEDGGQTHLGYAGMITDGNREGRFMIYEAARIRDLVNRLATEDAFSGS